MYVFQKVPRLPPVFVYAIALGLSSFFIPAAAEPVFVQAMLACGAWKILG